MKYSFREIDLALATDGSGDASVTSVDSVLGVLWAIDLTVGTLTTSGTITISAVSAAADGTDRTLFVIPATLTSGLYLVRKAAVKAADFTASGGYEALPVIQRKIKAVVAAGGASKAGSLRLIVLQ